MGKVSGNVLSVFYVEVTILVDEEKAVAAAQL